MRGPKLQLDNFVLLDYLSIIYLLLIYYLLFVKGCCHMFIIHLLSRPECCLADPGKPTF